MRKANGKFINGGKWITRKRRLAIYLRDGFKCVYCEADLTQARPKAITLDHVKPRSKGGCHKTKNLLTACLMCNCARGDRTVEEFLRRTFTSRRFRERALRRIRLTVTTKLDSYLPLADDILNGHKAGRIRV